MNIGQVDLNLLVYFEALIKHQSVTKAANELGITQPAMSNALKRLRDLFDDPILVRSSKGMAPTKFSLEIHPDVALLLASVENILLSDREFDHRHSTHVFRIAVSDYVETTLIPSLLRFIRKEAPYVTLDLLTPSDVTMEDIETGQVDMIINRFDNLPQSFYQKTLWRDSYSCVFNKKHALSTNLSLETYLNSDHIWVSKTGMGSGERMESTNAPRLGWVDKYMKKMGYKRNIALFTRHYQSAILLAHQSDLVVTLPSRATHFYKNAENLVIQEPPFKIPPIEIKMAWSPRLQSDKRHKWLRDMISNNFVE